VGVQFTVGTPHMPVKGPNRSKAGPDSTALLDRRRVRPPHGGRNVPHSRAQASGVTAASLLVHTAAQAVPAKTPPLTTPWTAQALNGTPLPEYPVPR
jgi:hypothetical protein